ncbi:MAG: hypothetical protein VX938_13615, partial [Myxococcota bacterium]|nr:hypothetical protein [Myxococcota bacterium]
MSIDLCMMGQGECMGREITKSARGPAATQAVVQPYRGFWGSGLLQCAQNGIAVGLGICESLDHKNDGGVTGSGVLPFDLSECLCVNRLTAHVDRRDDRRVEFATGQSTGCELEALESR